MYAWALILDNKKKSSQSISRVLSLVNYKMSVIYLRILSPISSSGLPSDVGRATLVDVGLHDLTTPKMHSTTCHHVSGGLLLHLLTLTIKDGGYFLLHYSAFANSFPLGSRMLYVARTFLFCHRHQRQTVQLLLHGKDKDNFLVAVNLGQ